MKPRRYQLSQLQMADFTLAGYSIGGVESVVVVPELDCAFDIGKCPPEALAVNHVLLTHGHMDHVAGLPYYFSQRDFQGITGGVALVPAELVGPLKNLMVAWGNVEGRIAPHEFIGMRPGEDYEIRRGLVARAFATRHVPGSLGYALIEVRRKLKEEFADKANYAALPSVAQAKALLIECTFFDDDHIRRARAGKHLHITDLPEVLDGMNNERIILIHVTRRTNLSAARKILRRTLPKDVLQRVTFLMSRKHIEQA